MTARIRITKEPCSQCPWKGNLPLSPGRLKYYRDKVRKKEGTFICHKTMLTHDGSHITYSEGDGTAICRGWADAFRKEWPPELQIAERLGYVAYVDDEGKEVK